MKRTVIAFITTITVLSMMFISPVKALENSIALTKQDDQIAVTLNISDTNKEALSMQAAFQIESESGSVAKDNIQFHFDENITSVVKEYRYDNGLLTIYISGQNNLFTGKRIKLGTIAFDVEKNTELNISFVEDSLEYVSSSYSKSALDVQNVSIKWDNITKPADAGDQDTSANPQTPSQGTNEESKDTTKAENSQVSSTSQTGDDTNIWIYLYIALASLTVVLYLIRRKYVKIH